MGKTDVQLLLGDALQLLEKVEDRSIDLVVADPPYNIGVETQKDNEFMQHGWDRRPKDEYFAWMVEWLNLCSQKLKTNGVLYFWHSDMASIAHLMELIANETPLKFRSFCIWNKGHTFRSNSWMNYTGRSELRCWFNVCEYCLHFFNTAGIDGAAWNHTGMDMINSNPECYRELKDWYHDECGRLGLTNRMIADFYTERTGRKPHMLRHYFQDSQFEIPTREVWEAVYMPLGFGMKYEKLRMEYEKLRHYHMPDVAHCNVWNVPGIPTNDRYHTCEKPVEILRRIIRVSCPPGGSVLDPFMGSGSTGVAAVMEKRHFIGIEIDSGCYATATERIRREQMKHAESTVTVQQVGNAAHGDGTDGMRTVQTEMELF